MIANTNQKDPIYDQRVRGHDFLAYFKSHVTAICLVFWFFTITVTVTATAIYLMKNLESDQSLMPTTVKTTAGKGGGQREVDGKPGGSMYEGAYANYDVLGFLIDAMYAGDELYAKNASLEAATAGLPTRHRQFKVPDTSTKATPLTQDVLYSGPNDYNNTFGVTDY